MAFDPKDPADVKILNDAVAEAVEALGDKNKELLRELKVAKAKVKTEVDPAEVEKLETQIEKLQADLTTAQKDLKTATKAAEDANTALTGERGFNERLLVDNGLNGALLEAGVQNPAHLKGAAALIRSNKVEVVIEGENRVAKIGGKPLAEFVKEWSQSDDGKAYVSAPGNGGGGAKGSGGKGGGVNPWAKETFNLTDQGKLLTENPTLAATYQAAAGATP